MADTWSGSFPTGYSYTQQRHGDLHDLQQVHILPIETHIGRLQPSYTSSHCIMGVLDRFTPGAEASSSKTNVTGVNDIPAPRSDAAANTPPAQLHKRVADFVNVSRQKRFREE